MSTTIEQLDRIVRTAHEAFAAARDVAPRTRANWLEAIATALEGAGDELLALAHEETHLPEGRLRGELARTVFQIRLLLMRYFAGSRWMPPSITLIPVGVWGRVRIYGG